MKSRYIQFIIISTIVQTILVHADADAESLKSPPSDELDPLNDSENSKELIKEQDKRTIFNPAIKNVAWVKHTALNPSGAKYVLGYGTVDLKLKPVLRPIAIRHQGYHYNRPKIHFHLKRPVVVKPLLDAGWKPIFKPVVPILKPIQVPAPLQVIKPIKPVHVDHIHAVKPVHVDQVHVEPGGHVDHLHLNPIPHVDHVHKEPIVHVDHIQPVHITDHVHHVTTGHINHLHHVSTPHVQPGVVHTPFVPSAQLFEVTKPDLGVLPLGTVFPTTALKEIAAPQLVPQPVVPIHNHVHPLIPVSPLPAPVAPVSVQIPSAPLPIAPTAPVYHVNPIGAVHPTQLPITHFPPVNHVHPIAQISPAEPIGHIHTNDHLHSVAHFHQQHIPTVEHIHPGGYPYPGNHPYSIGHLHQENVHQILPASQPYSVNINSVGHLNQEHINPLEHFHYSAGQQYAVDHTHTAGHNINTLPSTDQIHSDYPHLHLGTPQSGTQVDYHGNHFLNSLGPEQPPVQHLLPDRYNFQYPQIPQTQVPTNEGSNNIYPNQQTPQFLDTNQNGYQEGQSQSNGFPNQFQPEPNIQDHYPNVQEENRYQPANQVSNQHFYRDGQFQIGNQNEEQGYVYQQPSQGRFIQPGQTDLQFPLHLPNHPGFNKGYNQDNHSEASQNHERSFKPSIQLEPPYKK